MWKIGITTGWENDQRLHITKPTEIAAVMCNLRRYVALLKVSRAASAVEAAYLHKEVGGVVSVDSTGVEEVDLRIYTFADEVTRILHLLCLGKADEKNSDIEYCKQLVYYIVNQRGLGSVE